MTKINKLPSLSVFFPCFNEEPNVELFVKEAIQVLPQVAKQFEIIVVNDGSSDGTGAVADELAKKNKKIKVVHHQKNKGYGAALRSGFDAAKYDWVFFTDGDLQFRLFQLKKLIPHTEKYDVVIGFRKNRADGAVRAFNARLFKFYIDILFRVHVRDIDCAFKLFKTDVIKSLNLTSSGAFISAEFLYKLKKKHEEFRQVPVDHHERRYGSPTGNNIKVIIKAGFEALWLYLSMKFGFLKKKGA